MIMIGRGVEAFKHYKSRLAGALRCLATHPHVIGSRYVQRSYENLEKFREMEKKSKYKARFERYILFHTQEPQHYTSTTVVAAANHYFPPFIDKP